MDRPHENPRYIACKHIPRLKEDSITVDEGLAKTIIAEADILPLFEQQFSRYKQLKCVSLVSNEFLRCRWREFVKRINERAPFHFPTVDDLHFSRCSIRYDPKESISNRVNNRFHLRMGPGVDKYGQIPVPDDMHLRKTVYVKPRDKKIEKNIKASKKKKEKNDS